MGRNIGVLTCISSVRKEQHIHTHNARSKVYYYQMITVLSVTEGRRNDVALVYAGSISRLPVGPVDAVQLLMQHLMLFLTGNTTFLFYFKILL